MIREADIDGDGQILRRIREDDDVQISIAIPPYSKRQKYKILKSIFLAKQSTLSQ